MSSLVLLLVLATSPNPSLPPEVGAFVADREACDHFRGEPIEGDTAEQVQRREFVLDSLRIFCAGTDRRLAALKERYSGNAQVMSVLDKYESEIEAPNCEP